MLLVFFNNHFSEGNDVELNENVAIEIAFSTFTYRNRPLTSEEHGSLWILIDERWISKWSEKSSMVSKGDFFANLRADKFAPVSCSAYFQNIRCLSFLIYLVLSF